jgi:putative ABC transport system ATP-binding protein
MVIGNISGMEVVIPFAESDASRLAFNQDVQVTFDAVPNLTISGHVIAVASAPTVSSGVVNYYATVTLNQTSKTLKQGMTANATVTVSKATNAITVPNLAISRAAGQAYVYVYTSGQQVQTPIETGVVGDQFTEVTGGLNDGESVVLPTVRAASGTGSGTTRLGGGGGGQRPVVITLEAVTKTYRMGRLEVPAVRGIDLHVAQREFVAIMGASGSGKSTLMNIIGCLDVPTTGRYLLDGTDVAKLDDDRLAQIRNRKIGFVFQSFNLIPRTSALHNVEMPLIYAGQSGRTERAREALGAVGLADRERHQPSELSGGQQQRAAIARALVTNPAILLADEPTGNLDSGSSVEIMRLLSKLNTEQGRTIVLITHEQDIARFAERVVELRDGRIVRDERRAA